MKKYIFKTILCSTLAMSLTTSCDMDQYPDSYIPSEKSWETVSDAEKFYVGLLASIRGNADNSAAVSEVQSDLFNAMIGNTSLTKEHDWTFTTNQFGGDGCWAGNYGLITTANNILDNIDKIPVSNSDEEAIINNIKGASYFARAFAYSNLAPRYCANYDEATAETKNSGLPLMKNVDVNAKPHRSTLKETYDFILSDIEKASELIREFEGDGDYYLPNLDAVTALKARVCLYTKQYDEAIEAATSLFENHPLTPADEYNSLWLDDAGSEIIFEPTMTKEERGNAYGIYIGWNEASKAWQPSYVPTQGLMDLYEDQDIRKEVFFRKKVKLSANDQEDKGYMLDKFPGNPELRKDGEDKTNSRANMVKVFRTSEMYLIAAEASLFKATPDEAAAQSYLSELRENRGVGAIKSTGSYLIKDLKNEWTRETVGEGYRLNNLKRWGDGVKRMAPQQFTKNMLVAEPTELNIQPEGESYYKILWEIPLQDTQANNNLTTNWPK